ncbi:MAG TPA: AI-2E family transporter [Casimicrobiaceae bacterium]|jgi:predicted PurR-regulated permease PerM|nr:AI-2E family transporter [Casimicrobiaceae bacterium]
MNSDDTPPPRPWPAAERALVVLAVLAVIGAAKVTESFLVPVVAGVMLSYTLEPLVRGLERVRIHRAIGSAVVLLCVIGIVGVSGFLLRDDAKALMAQLPDAAHQIRLAALARKGPEGPIDHVRAAAAELNKAAAEATGTAPAPQAVATPPTLSTDIQHWITDQSAKMLGVVTQLGIAALLAYFLLAAGDTFRRKVVHLAGPTLARRRITVEILDDIHIQVQRYLVVLLFTNMLIALAIWGVLTLSGIDRAGLWGAIAGVLHVIPYAGTALTTGAIAVAVYVQTQSLGSTFGVALAVLTVSSAIGMGLVPWLQGKAARMNAAAVFVALLFFGWLWGGWGLLLGAPLAAVLKTIADRIPRMDAVGELMGGADVGTPAVPKVSEEAPRPKEAPATRARSRRATRATG